MQVATLFRETATLLGASMESSGSVGGSLQDMHSMSGGSPDNESHMHHQYKMMSSNIKPEPLDDGYETSADMLPPHSMPLKCKQIVDDPYSFVDDDASTEMHSMHSHVMSPIPHQMRNPLEIDPITPGPKKRGRKKKIKEEPGMEIDGVMTRPPAVVKERKKHDRFNGMPEEEVSKRTLPDHLTQNLDIIIIGINPGLFAAYKGHHYAGPGNHFWKCLYLSGLTPEQMSADEDYKLLQVGIGFTNMVQRATKGSADLTRKEIKEGSQILLEKLQHFKPKIAVFNGKLIFEVFSGKKDFSFGRQPDLVDGTSTYMWVMPSSSARCAQLPRAADKVPFYAALKKFRDYLNGMVATLDESEVVFNEAKLKMCFENEHKSENSILYPDCNSDIIDISNAVIKKDEDVPGKKKRGRPKKIKVEGEINKPSAPRKPSTASLNSDAPKKKRGRPKKIKPDEHDILITDRSSALMKCFSSPSPLHSPVTNFCQMNLSQSTPPTPGTPVGYTGLGSIGSIGSIGITHQPYTHSPQPQSFTHSDLSSEISAAISSEHLGSPAPTSPSLGPPDFDPPTNMPTEDTTECRFSSPTPSTVSEHPPTTVSQLSHSYSSYRGFTTDTESYSQGSIPGSGSTPEYKIQDVSSKSLSGLESLVDQIPSIADGETVSHNVGVPSEVSEPYIPSVYSGYPSNSAISSSPTPTITHYPTASYGMGGNDYGSLSASLSNGPSSFSVSSLASNYNPLNSNINSYSNLMGAPGPHHLSGGGSGMYMEPHMPVPVSPLYHPYGQQYAVGGYSSVAPPPPGLHMPSPNYPYYNSGYGHQPGTTGPSYLPNMFDRIKPDIGYGGF